MNDLSTDMCPIPNQNGTVCDSRVTWEVTPAEGAAYVACGQHVTAPLFRDKDKGLIPFCARPVSG
ncbi:hypothetical protein AB0O42_22865 [Streptomyces sp. NPDC089922]|uniref:hypothetical protein n=1 Tax=Streptomyces sp. NPDC089922 TaxID=3155189 RepID=UPI0034360B39